MGGGNGTKICNKGQNSDAIQVRSASQCKTKGSDTGTETKKAQ